MTWFHMLFFWTFCVWKNAYIITFYIYIYAFSRRFYPKRLTLHSSYSFTFYQLLLSLGIEPMILALLAPCSTIWATGKPLYTVYTKTKCGFHCKTKQFSSRHSHSKRSTKTFIIRQGYILKNTNVYQPKQAFVRVCPARSHGNSYIFYKVAN